MMCCNKFVKEFYWRKNNDDDTEFLSRGLIHDLFHLFFLSQILTLVQFMYLFSRYNFALQQYLIFWLHHIIQTLYYMYIYYVIIAGPVKDQKISLTYLPTIGLYLNLV